MSRKVSGLALAELPNLSNQRNLRLLFLQNCFNLRTMPRVHPDVFNTTACHRFTVWCTPLANVSCSDLDQWAAGLGVQTAFHARGQRYCYNANVYWDQVTCANQNVIDTVDVHASC
eukprot:TRINITY_DN8821_c0_g1_i1.p1 TRINITY_DN8821_c0_g1~~TRINITY_DN8821_c0_g1_i1.p1  ORF type:complete len:116 (+),score=15.67 TRINITY_DN8821_c0_g1_i1:194-541(+)